MWCMPAFAVLLLVLPCRFDDLVGDNICPLDVELKWMTEVSSSVYATPLITDLYADGRKDIIVPGFVHYTDVLEGPDGAKALGWPGFHKSTVHASPLLYDIDSDGIQDILVATYDGEILFFKDNVSFWGLAVGAAVQQQVEHQAAAAAHKRGCICRSAAGLRQLMFHPASLLTIAVYPCSLLRRSHRKVEVGA